MAKRRRSRKAATASALTILAAALVGAGAWLQRGQERAKHPTRPQAQTPAPARAADPKDLAFKEPFRATVLSVADGDTITVTGNQKVRLLGVDTIETRSGKRLEGQAGQLGMDSERALKWGRKAKEFTERELLNADVELRPGYERFDRYGRLLAYVWYKPAGGEEMICFNHRLIEEGFALATRQFEHPTKQECVDLEAAAKRGKKGLWAYAGR